MITAIQQVSKWQSMTAAQIAVALNAPRSIRKSNNPQLQDGAWATGARGLRDFGPQVWTTMMTALTTLGFGVIREQLSFGLDFGDPQTQAMIDQLGQAAPEQFTPEHCAVLKAWGVDTTSLADQYLTQPATEQAIQEALDAYRFEQRRTNAIALFTERMTIGGNAGVVMNQAWSESVA